MTDMSEQPTKTDGAAVKKASKSLLKLIKDFRVSSVLNDDKQFGKNNMLDGSAETCWNSAQGSPQSILIRFSKLVNISQVQIMFQGGFAGKTCQFHVGGAAEKSESKSEVKSDESKEDTAGDGAESSAKSAAALKPSKTLKLHDTHEPANNNSLQSFACKASGVLSLKIVFPDSTDLFGRITIYKLDVKGAVA